MFVKHIFVKVVMNLNPDCFIHIIDQVTDLITLMRLIKVNKLFKDITVRRFNELYSASTTLGKYLFTITWSLRPDFRPKTISYSKTNPLVKIAYQNCKVKGKNIKIPYYRINEYKYWNTEITYYHDKDSRIIVKSDKPKLTSVNQSESVYQIYLIDQNVIRSRRVGEIEYRYDRGGRLIEYLDGGFSDGSMRYIVHPFTGQTLCSFKRFNRPVTIRGITFEIDNDKLDSFWVIGKRKLPSGYRFAESYHRSDGEYSYDGEPDGSGIKDFFTCYCDKCEKTGKGKKLFFLMTSHRMFWPVVDMVPEDQKRLFGCYMRRKTHCYYCQRRLGRLYVKTEGERWHGRCYNKVSKLGKVN